MLASIGDTVKLDCNAKSDPIPRFSWLRNNYETFTNVAIRDYTSSMEVKIETEENFHDIYTCVAMNDHGRSNQTFILKERSEPESSDARKTSDVAMNLSVLIASLIMCFNHV